MQEPRSKIHNLNCNSLISDDGANAQLGTGQTTLHSHAHMAHVISANSAPGSKFEIHHQLSNESCISVFVLAERSDIANLDCSQRNLAPILMRPREGYIPKERRRFISD